MAEWKKIITENSDATLNSVTSSFSGDGGNLGIGTPTDASYSDGFFDTFNSSSRLADVIDEISEAFLDLAPAKAGLLTGTTLTRTTPSVFSGYLAGGLDNNDWYQVGASANSLISSLVNSPTVSLRTSGSSIFRSGKYSDYLAGNMIGGVSASIASSSQTLQVVDRKAFGNGTPGPGANNIISVLGTSRFNTFWTQTSASLSHIMIRTGSYRYVISADNGAGSTLSQSLWYVGSITDYPDVIISSATASYDPALASYNYLSGIEYLKQAVLNINIVYLNAFKPVYNQNQASISSTYLASSITTGSNSVSDPNTTINISLTSSLATNKNINGQASATLTVSKPGKTNVTQNFNINPAFININSYITSGSTNSTDIFVDEAKRVTDLLDPNWDSFNTLNDGQLQVKNGILIPGARGDYGSFSQGLQQYFRNITPQANGFKGSFAFAVSGFTSISPWNSGGELEIAFVKESDVTGPDTYNTIYDLGRAFGTNSGAIKGVVIGTAGSLSGTFSMGTDNVGSDNVILWIRINGNPNKWLTSLNLTITT